MPSNKCYGCQRRHVGCHIECEDYQKFRQKFRAEQNKVLKAKALDREADALQMKRTIDKANMHAMKRKAGRK